MLLLIFYLFFDGPVDMQIWAPRTRIQCRLSDTQVTVKARVSCNLEKPLLFPPPRKGLLITPWNI